MTLLLDHQYMYTARAMVETSVTRLKTDVLTDVANSEWCPNRTLAFWFFYSAELGLTFQFAMKWVEEPEGFCRFYHLLALKFVPLLRGQDEIICHPELMQVESPNSKFEPQTKLLSAQI